MPPVNLANVNISLQQFQDISSGKYNAGEVKLESETTLGKINHHVHRTGANDKSLSHEEVLAIKNAFVKALSSHGVAEAEIGRIRRDLGLAADAGIDKTLHARSLKPLSRQQVREILDRNAAAINASRTENGDRVFIAPAARLPGADAAARAARGDEVNAALAGTRSTSEHAGVALAEAVVAGDVDFRSYEDSQALAAQARAQLAQILEKTKGAPSAEREAVVEFRLRATGQSVRIPTGRSEAAFVRRLEEMLVRLNAVQGTDERSIAVRTAFGAIESAAARRDWLDGLAGAPDAGFKVRTAVVLMLTDAGIDDYETLSLVNRVDDEIAFGLARTLAALDGGLRGDALRGDQAMLSLAHLAADGVEVPQDACAAIPATSAKQWNAAIRQAISGNEPENLPHDVRALVDALPGRLRDQFGPDFLEVGETGTRFIGSADSYEVAPEDLEDRITAENLRDRLDALVQRKAAQRYASGLIDRAIVAAGGGEENSPFLWNDWETTRPALKERLLAARTAAEADAVFAEFRPEIEADARRFAAVQLARNKAAAWYRDALARRLGVPSACLSSGLELDRFERRAGDLAAAIRRGQHPAATDAEIEAAFRSYAENAAASRADAIAAVERMDLPPALRDAVKDHVLAIDRPEKLDVAATVAAARAGLGALVAAVDAALVPGVPKEAVYAAMKSVAEQFGRVVRGLFPPEAEFGAEEQFTHGTVVSATVIHDIPGFAEKLVAFFARPDVRADEGDLFKREKPAFNSGMFKMALPPGGVKVELAASLGTPSMPPFHAQALMKAFEEAGLGALSVAERMAMLRPSHPAGSALASAVAQAPGLVSPARLRELAVPILRSLAGAADVALPPADRARLEAALAKYAGGLSEADKARLREYAESLDFSEAAAPDSEKAVARHLDEICGGGGLDNPASSASRRALAAGFALADLPTLARVAYVVEGGGAVTDRTIDALLDPQSDFRRGWDAALLRHHGDNGHPERLATLAPGIKIGIAAAVRACGDDADLLAIVTAGIDRVTANGAGQIRGVTAVARIVADVRANLAELREATAGDPDAYAAGLEMLKGLEARRVPPGFVRHLVDSVRRAPVDALAKLRARSSAAEIHAALLQFNRNADAILDAKKAQGLLDGADEIQICRAFLVRMTVARLAAAQRQGVRAALAAENAAQLVAFYGEVGQDNVEMPPMPGGVHTDVQRIAATLARDARNLFGAVRRALGEPDAPGGIPAPQGEIDMGRIGAAAALGQIRSAAEAECAAAGEAYLRETFPGASPAAAAMRGIFQRRIAATPSIDPSITLATSYSTTVARMINTNIVIGAKTLATMPFADSQFAKDRARGMDVVLPGGARLSTDPATAADEIARFVTGRPDAAYAQLAPAERNQVHVVMTLLTQDSVRSVVDGPSIALDPEGRTTTFAHGGGANAHTWTFRLERDPDNAIVVKFDATFRPTHLLAGTDAIPLGPGSQIRGSFELTLPTATMNAIGGLDFAGCDTAPAQATLDAQPPVAQKVAAALNQLPAPFRFGLHPSTGFGFVLN